MYLVSFFFKYYAMSEYNKPAALLPKKNVYAPIIALKIAEINEPMSPILANNPPIQFKIIATTSMITIIAKVFTIPTA